MFGMLVLMPGVLGMPQDYADKHVYMCIPDTIDTRMCDLYNECSLYGCVIRALCDTPPTKRACGGTLILPSAFLVDTQKRGIALRRTFMSLFQITRVTTDIHPTLYQIEFAKNDTYTPQRELVYCTNGVCVVVSVSPPMYC